MYIYIFGLIGIYKRQKVMKWCDTHSYNIVLDEVILLHSTIGDHFYCGFDLFVCNSSKKMPSFTIFKSNSIPSISQKAIWIWKSFQKWSKNSKYKCSSIYLFKVVTMVIIYSKHQIKIKHIYEKCQHVEDLCYHI